MNIEETKAAIRVMQAFVDGKEVECWDRGLEGWETTNNPSWDWMDCTFRIKPTAKLRPWTADEVPLGSIMRTKGLEGRCIIVATETSDDRAYWLNAREHSTDGGKTWLPCGVVEEANS